MHGDLEQQEHYEGARVRDQELFPPFVLMS